MSAPHPQSRAALLALHRQLHAEAYARAEVYSRMFNKRWMDWRIVQVLFRTRCFHDCIPRLIHTPA